MTINPPLYPLLDVVKHPDDLRTLACEQLPQLCDEVRRYLLNSVSQSSGHLASGLGVVELTVALHYVYNTPFDRLLWDVGHQAYPHKILTGRADLIHTIRQQGGLHPFPWRDESEFDTLNVGHSSTSISAGLGMAIAADREGQGRKVVSVIGDGAMTAGMAFEAMNHAGDIHPNMLVVLNDNEMSISENVGGLNNSLARLLSGQLYANIREGGKKVLAGLPSIKELARRTEEHLKGMVIPGTFFEELGFNYIGPIDGHDVDTLVTTLSNMRELKGPQLLHIKTRKGKGYEPAEKDPIKYHAVPRKYLETAEKTETPTEAAKTEAKVKSPTYSQVFGDWLCDMATEDDRLMAITPAMREGSGMVRFSQEFPQQYFDAAIAEQHAVTLGVGMALEKFKPVVAIYSTFLQRAYDQVIHDMAIHKADMLLAIDRAGIVGADGPTHQGAFDISFLRCIPNLVLMTPSDENECRQMLFTGYQHHGPAAVRYPRGNGPGTEIQHEMQALEIGKGIMRRHCKKQSGQKQEQREKVAILNFGARLSEVMKAAKKLDASVADMRFVKPLDTELVRELAASHDVLITVEENAIAGGAGSGVIEFLQQEKLLRPVLNLGLPDHFVVQATPEQALADLGLDSAGIERQIRDYLAK